MAGISDLGSELIVQGIIGLLVGGAAIRAFAIAWADTRAKLTGQSRQNPIVAGVAMGWDNNQLERVAQSLETIAKAAMTYDASTKNRSEQLLHELLQKMNDAEEDRVRERLERKLRD